MTNRPRTINPHNQHTASYLRSLLTLVVLSAFCYSLFSPEITLANLAAATTLPQPSPTSNQNGASRAATGATAGSVIQRIRERNNTLLAGVKYDFEPFGFVDDSGNVAGFDVDLVHALADQWGVKVQFVQVNSSNRLQFLANGAVDLVAASMTHTKAREATIDFSQTYFLDGQSLLVRANTPISDVQDLAGKTVAAIQGSTSLDNLRELATKNNLKLSLLPFQEYPQAVAALKAGQVDALTTDSAFLLRAAQKNPELRVVGERFSEEPYGMGVPAGDSYFRDLVNFTLETLKTNGTYDRIYAEWFPDDKPYPVELLPGHWPYTFANSPVAASPPAQTRLAVIRKRGKVLVGVKYDFPPFGFVDAQGEVQGFDVDIAHEFAARWLGDATAVELVPVTSDTRIPFLATGAVDLIIASMTHTQQRDDTIDFSETYFLDGQSLLVRKNSGIDGLTALNGKSVAAVVGSTSIDNIRTIAKARNLQVTVLPFQEYPSALEALKAGQVDALTTDSMALAQFAKDDPTVEVVGEPFTEEPYGIGVPNFDSQFRNLVNATLQAMQLDGVYATLSHKWLGALSPYPIEVWPGAVLSPTLSSTSATAPATPTPTNGVPTNVAPTSVAPTDVTGTIASKVTTPTLRPSTQPTKTATPRLILIPTATPAAPSVPSPTDTATPTILPTSTPQPSESPTPTLHRVAAGENLGTLAVRYYGKYALWTVIYEANREKIGTDPNRLPLGLELIIPPEP